MERFYYSLDDKDVIIASLSNLMTLKKLHDLGYYVNDDVPYWDETYLGYYEEFDMLGYTLAKIFDMDRDEVEISEEGAEIGAIRRMRISQVERLKKLEAESPLSSRITNFLSWFSGQLEKCFVSGVFDFELKVTDTGLEVDASGYWWELYYIVEPLDALVSKTDRYIKLMERTLNSHERIQSAA